MGGRLYSSFTLRSAQKVSLPTIQKRTSKHGRLIQARLNLDVIHQSSPQPKRPEPRKVTSFLSRLLPATIELVEEPRQNYFYESAEFQVSRKMTSRVSVLTTPTVDTAGTALVLSFEDKRYLFGNAHEGLQRVCIQSGTGFQKLQHLFLTGKNEWKNTGGILGFILTIADSLSTALAARKQTITEAQTRWEERLRKAPNEAERERILKSSQPKDKLSTLEKPSLDIHGGDNLMQLLATARRFIFRKGLPLRIHEHGDSTSTAEPTWADSNIKVWALPLRPESQFGHRNPQATQKRSFDDYTETPPILDDESLGPFKSAKDTLKGVISDMFDSQWRMDALIERPLAEVKLPAALFIRNPETKKLETYQGPMPDSGEDISEVKVLVRMPWPGALVANLPETRPSSTVMSYIVKNQPRRGKFDPIQAKSLGINPGPIFSKLARGESVQNDKGETVTPEQVCGPLRSGRGFAIIEIPSIEYIPALNQSFAFHNQEVMDSISTVFWLLGSGVTKEPIFQSLVKHMSSFEHIISSPDHGPNNITIDAAATAQMDHRQIDNARYSLPLYSNHITPLPSELTECVIAQRGFCLDMEPELKLSTKPEPELLHLYPLEKDQTVLSLARRAETIIGAPDFQLQYQNQNLPAGETEIVTLGTGSALPSKQRNVSSTLVRVPNIGSYLLDAGENTLGQLSRLYDPQELKSILQDLKLIWISHMHADHHLGLTSIIRAWHSAVHGDAQSSGRSSSTSSDIMSNTTEFMISEQKLCVVAEREMLHWLKEYSEIESFGYDKILPLQVYSARVNDQDQIDIQTRLSLHGEFVGFNSEDRSVKEALRQVTGLSDLQAVNVIHCKGARAVSMTWPNELKISYSGDCRPSKAFTVIGSDSTVLIHEATFDDELLEDAKAKKHTTSQEAIGVGIRMKAKRIILTHFSQRYSKAPEMQNIAARRLAYEDEDLAREQVTGPVTEPEESESIPHGAAEEVESLPTHAKVTVERRLSQTESAEAENIKIGVAFDFMRVKIKDIMLLGEYNSAFQKLYEEKDYVSSEKAMKRAEGEAMIKKKVEEKKARQEQQRQRQIEQAALKRKSSKASLKAEASTASEVRSTENVAMDTSQ